MGITRSEPSKNNDAKRHKPLDEEKLAVPSENVNLDIWKGQYRVLEKIILEYAFEPKRLETPQTKFWTPSLKQEILSLVYYAAPLNEVENYVNKAYARGEKHLRDTLVEAAVEAIKNGDVTLKDEKGNVLKDAKGNVIAEGMAEKLMELHDNLYPGEKCIEKVRANLPIEDEQEKKAREDANVAAVTQVFDAIRLNDQKTNTAIKTFKELVATSTPLNRIHLLFVAFDVFARRGGELPSIDGEEYGQWWGKLADRFCFEVIGDAIESDLPPRIQQLLKTGLYYVLKASQVVGRELDIEGLAFREFSVSHGKLGAAFYSDRRPFPVSQACGQVFRDLLQAFTSAYTAYATDNLSHRAIANVGS